MTHSFREGASCPITPAAATKPWWKRTLLFFFRFGICPVCITMSISYSLVQWWRASRGVA